MLPEYHRATPSVRIRSHWSMYDSMTAEVEVLEFLATLVDDRQAEPDRGRQGVSRGQLDLDGAGAEADGFGRIVSCEFDPQVFAKAQEKMRLRAWPSGSILRNVSEPRDGGQRDHRFVVQRQRVDDPRAGRCGDSSADRPNGLVLMHDASSHPGMIREAALRLEAEGLLSVVLLPTPRGWRWRMKRAGRK